MSDNNKLETISNLFEGKEIRSIWDAEKEEYFFSVVDVIGALTESPEPRKYWSVLKNRLKKEGSEVTTKCSQLKMLSFDGKIRLRDAMETSEIYQTWSGMKASEYKKYKNIRKESLRDNMTDVEVALTDLGEIATRELAKKHKPQGLKANRKIAKAGGEVAKTARDDLERKLGETVISRDNQLNYEYIEDIQKIESKNERKKLIKKTQKKK